MPPIRGRVICADVRFPRRTKYHGSSLSKDSAAPIRATNVRILSGPGARAIANQRPQTSELSTFTNREGLTAEGGP